MLVFQVIFSVPKELQYNFKAASFMLFHRWRWTKNLQTRHVGSAEILMGCSYMMSSLETVNPSSTSMKLIQLARDAQLAFNAICVYVQIYTVYSELNPQPSCFLQVQN